MAKRDFMSELARELEEQKSGKRDHIENINDYTSSHPLQVHEAEDYEELGEHIVETKKETPKKQSSLHEEKPAVMTMEEAYIGEGNEPDSFQEEKREKIEKPRRQIKPLGVLILLLLAALIAFLIYYFAFAPKIVVGNFVGNNVSEVTTWAKQNKMETSAIAKREEYSLIYDKDVVIEQSLEAGTKIKTSTPFTVTVSLGADPDEEVDFPSDLSNMTLSEIREWIDENKLTKTKVTTQYSGNVPDGNVISYELKNTTESEFTRGSTLNIICSKGPAPAGQVAVENYVGKTFAEMSSWANTKKIVLEKHEEYSEDKEAGIIISMDKKAGDTIEEGSTIVVVVSKGKGVKIPNLVGYTKEQLDAWQASKYNTVTVITKSVHNAAAVGTVISQSIPAGSVVDSGDVLELTVSLYLPILETNSREWLGKDYLQLKAWVDEVNSKGASIQAGEYGVFYEGNTCSDEYTTPGQIIEYACLYGTSDLAEGCGRPLNLNSRIAYRISTGACTAIQIVLNQSDLNSLDSIKAFCAANNLSYHIQDNASESLQSDSTVAVQVSGGTMLYNMNDSFPYVLKQNDHLEIYWTTVSTAKDNGGESQSETSTANDNSESNAASDSETNHQGEDNTNNSGEGEG